MRPWRVGRPCHIPPIAITHVFQELFLVNSPVSILVDALQKVPNLVHVPVCAKPPYASVGVRERDGKIEAHKICAYKMICNDMI
jgi:hypothetical protein